MLWWTGLAPWEFEFPFPGSLIYTFLTRDPKPQTPNSTLGAGFQGLSKKDMYNQPYTLNPKPQTMNPKP